MGSIDWSQFSLSPDGPPIAQPAPAPSFGLDDLIAKHADRTGLPPELLTALIQQESGRNPNAVNTESGATGLGQLMPGTARMLGVTDRTDPDQAIGGAADYLKQGFDKYGTVDDALKYYYGGPNEKMWGPRTQAYPDQVKRHLPDGSDVQTSTTKPEAVDWSQYSLTPSGAPIGKAADSPSAKLDAVIAEQKNKHSALGEILTQFKRGLYEGAAGAGATLQAPAEMAGEEPGMVSQAGKALEEFGKQGAAQPDLQPAPDQHNALTNIVAEGARGLGGAVPLLASQAGGALAGGVVAGPPGAIAGGAAAGGGQAALQTWHDEYHRYLDAHPGDEAGARLHADKSAALQGTLMAGVGAATGGIGAGLRVAGKVAGVGTNAAEAAADATSKSFLPEFAKGSAEMAAVNTGLGVAGAAGQAAIDQSTGLPTPGPLEAAKAALVPALGSSVGFLPLTAWGALGSARNARAIGRALTDVTTDPMDRAEAADQIYKVMKQADPAAADTWKDNASAAITAKQPIAISPEWTSQKIAPATPPPPPGPTAADSIKSSIAAKEGSTLEGLLQPPPSAADYIGQGVADGGAPASFEDALSTAGRESPQPEAAVGPAGTQSAETTSPTQVGDAAAVANPARPDGAPLSTSEQVDALIQKRAALNVVPTPEELQARAAEQQAAQKIALKQQALTAEADARVEAQRQAESDTQRRGLLDKVLEDPDVRDPVGRYTAELRRAGFQGDYAIPSKDDLSRIQRFQDVQAAIEQEHVDAGTPQGTPNELDVASLVPEKKAPGAKSTAAAAKLPNDLIPAATAAKARKDGPTQFFQAIKRYSKNDVERRQLMAAFKQFTPEDQAVSAAATNERGTPPATSSESIPPTRSPAPSESQSQPASKQSSEGSRPSEASVPAAATPERAVDDDTAAVREWKAAKERGDTAAMKEIGARIEEMRRISLADSVAKLRKAQADDSAVRAAAGHDVAKAAAVGSVWDATNQAGERWKKVADDQWLNFENERYPRPKTNEQMGQMGIVKDRVSAPEDTVDAAAHVAATSPHNDLPEPTDAQKEAGNYQKGHARIGGLDISIENPEGSQRRPEWPPLKSHYGYIRGTVGKDKDHIDVFVKPGTAEDYAGPVFVVDQKNGKGLFDEHKVLLGWPDAKSAKAGYLENYTNGFKGLGAITETTMDGFKEWLAHGDTKAPFAPDATRSTIEALINAKKQTEPDQKRMLDAAIATVKALAQAPTDTALGKKLREQAKAIAKWDAPTAAKVAELATSVGETEKGKALRKRAPIETRTPGQANNAGVKRDLQRLGVDRAEQSDITGEKNGRRTGAMPGTFRDNGMTIDDWGERLVEDGWLPAESQSQRGNENIRASTDATRDFIRRVLAGEEVHKVGDLGDEAARRAELDHSAWVEQEAARMDDELSSGELRDLADSRFTREENETDFDAAGVLADLPEATRESILERAAMQAQNEGDYEQIVRSLAAAERPRAEGGVGDRSQARATSATDTDSAARANGRAGDAEVRHDAGDSGRASGREEPADVALELTAPTPAELKSQSEAAKAAAEKEAAAKATVEKAAREKAVQKEINGRSAAAADTFELGQSAEDNLSGQRDMLTAKGPALDRGALLPIVLSGGRRGTTLARATTDRIVDQVRAKWPEAPPIEIVKDPRDIGARNVPEDANGAYWRGKVYIVASNISDTAHLYRVLAHELVGHASMQDMAGKDGFGKILKEIQLAKKLGNPAILDLARSVEETHGKLTPEKEAEEIIARATERAVDRQGNVRPGYGWFKRVLSVVADWLRSKGIDVHFTDAELQGLISRAAIRLESKTPRSFAGDVAPVHSQGEPDLSRGYSLYSGVTRDEWPKESAFDALRKIFAPASRGPIATLQAGIMRDNFAQQVRRSELANHEMRQYAAVFDKMPQAEQIKFTNDYERGIAPTDPKLAEIATQMRAFNDERRKMVQDLGTGKLEEFDENYLGRIWKDPEGKVRSVFGGRALEGSKGFLKQRTFDYFSQGLDAGLKPITYNPIEMMLLKGAETDRYVYGQRIFGEMKDAGLVAKWKAGEQPDGWTAISDKIAQAGEERYYAPDEAATLLNNHLSPGLRGNGAYDAFHQAGMMLNSLQLGLSAFHLGFTTLDAMVSKAALGVQQLSRGQFLKGFGSLANSINPAQPFLNAYKGDRLLRAYLGDLKDPNLAPIVEALVHGGGRVRMDEFYRNIAMNEFKQAVARNDKLGAAKAFLPTVIDRINAPIFEQIVPRQKLGVFFDMARDWLERNPDATVAEKREAMGKFWDSVDNRMGQLAYDNVFWHRTLKDALMVSVRSVGWNLGTFRELGGGLLDVKNVLKNKELSSRTGYVIALPFVTAILGSMVGYMYTGKGPDELKDYFFPKTGRKRPDGTDDRVSLPSYMKDVYAYGHDLAGFAKYGANPTGTLQNKLHPLLGVISQMLSNKDFLGGAIRSPGDPLVQQLEDEAKYLAAQVTPFGVHNYEQQAKTRGEEPSVAGYLSSPSMIGVTPSPAYVVKNDQQLEASALGSMKDSLMTKFREALQNGADPAQTFKRMIAAGLRPSEAQMIIRQGLATTRVPSRLPPRQLRSLPA